MVHYDLFGGGFVEIQPKRSKKLLHTVMAVQIPWGAPQVEPMLEALRAGDAPSALAALANNMEPAALQLAPAIAEVFAFLQDSGACQAGPLLCGSGSCVCAFVGDLAAAERLAVQAREHGWWACASTTLA